MFECGFYERVLYIRNTPKYCEDSEDSDDNNFIFVKSGNISNDNGIKAKIDASLGLNFLLRPLGLVFHYWASIPYSRPDTRTTSL